MTRWTTKDQQVCWSRTNEPKADQWHVVEFPAIMDHGSKNAQPVCEYWKLDELEKVQATLPTGKWNRSGCKQQQKRAQYLNVSGQMKYNDEEIPQLQRYTILRYSIFKKTADYSAITTWGIFYPTEDSGACLILLDSVKGRYDFGAKTSGSDNTNTKT